MTGKTAKKFSPEVRARAVRMVLDHASEHPSRWAAVTSIAVKIGCTPQTLHDWVKAPNPASVPAIKVALVALSSYDELAVVRAFSPTSNQEAVA